MVLSLEVGGTLPASKQAVRVWVSNCSKQLWTQVTWSNGCKRKNANEFQWSSYRAVLTNRCQLHECCRQRDRCKILPDLSKHSVPKAGKFKTVMAPPDGRAVPSPPESAHLLMQRSVSRFQPQS